MVPAHESLEAKDHSVLQAHGRLVMQNKLAPLDGTSQVGFQLHPVADRDVLLWLIALEAALSLCLGGVEGDIGVAHHGLGGVLRPRLDRDAHAESQRNLALLHPEWGLEMLDETLGLPYRLLLLDHALHEDRELVRAHSGHDVSGRDELAQASADHAEQVVAG